jgi:glucose-1-phosphate thymidylyltransferase
VEIEINVKSSVYGKFIITLIDETYLPQGDLKMQILSRGFAWLDTGTK